MRNFVFFLLLIIWPAIMFIIGQSISDLFNNVKNLQIVLIGIYFIFFAGSVYLSTFYFSKNQYPSLIVSMSSAVVLVALLYGAILSWEIPECRAADLLGDGYLGMCGLFSMLGLMFSFGVILLGTIIGLIKGKILKK